MFIINILYILLVIFVFGLLIAFHEFGHFITAKLSGVKVNEFAIGMGPAIIKKQKGDTLYALRIIPFGGYCAMEGEDDDSEEPSSFNSAPLWRRFLIVSAGSIMNLIVGVIVLALVFAPTKGWYIPTFDTLPENNAVVEQTGIMPGDTIHSFNGYRVYMLNDVFLSMSRPSSDDTHDMVVVRNGEKITLNNLPEGIEELVGNTEIFRIEKSTFLTKTKFVFQNAYYLVRAVKVGLVDLVSGNANVKDMSGPIGIGQMMVNTAKESLLSLWFLVAFISINLGIMNLLPLPALDGGRLMFLFIELIFRRPVPKKYEGYIHGIGFILLLALMAIVSFNDIARLLGF